jgi:hypothetical protein
VKLARKICRLVNINGAIDLASRTTDEFAAAVLALVTACEALEALDDQVLQVDHTSPYGPEDLPLP